MKKEIRVQAKDNSLSIETKIEEEIHVQVKDNSPSIERILRPISYISWLLGAGVARPQKCPKAITIIIRTIYMTVCSISLIYNVIGLTDISIWNMCMYLEILKETMVYVSAYYCIYHGIRQINKWPELMDKFKELDQKIKKEILIKDQPIKIIEALAIFAIIFYMSICIVYYIIENDIPWDFFFLMLHVIVVQSLFNSFVFDVVVYVLYYRFQTINKLIGQLDKSSDALAYKIKRIRELHSDICDLARKVNNIYSLHLLFCSANSFTMTVASLFQFYNFLEYHVYLFSLHQSFVCVVFVIKFYLTCWICTLTREESNRTGRIIYEIILKYQPVNIDKHKASNISTLEVRSSLENLDGEQCSNRGSSDNLSYIDMDNILRRNLDPECVLKEINDFSIQLQQHRVTFTACNFFEINNALFKGFVGLFITYLIIVSQLSQQSEEDFREKFDNFSKEFNDSREEFDGFCRQIDENFFKLRKDIMEIKEEIFELFLKENQPDSQN